RSSVAERRPRIITSNQRLRPRPRPESPARSTSSTSAPMSASIMPQKGPGPMASNSRIFSPARGPMALPEQLPGDIQQVYLARALVDAEGAHVAVEALDAAALDVALAAEYLYRAVGDAAAH